MPPPVDASPDRRPGAPIVVDGIEQLLVDDSGAIRVGYSDEGVNGNFGWGTTGPTPLGSPGFVRWSPQLEKVWEYRAVDDYRLADCYALNVGLDRTWACPDTDFPLLEIDADHVTVHRTTDIRGLYGLLVAGETVALIGGYQSLGSLLLGSLDGLDGLEETEIDMPDGRPVPQRTLVCRGSVGHLFVENDWFTFDLAQVSCLPRSRAPRGPLARRSVTYSPAREPCTPFSLRSRTEEVWPWRSSRKTMQHTMRPPAGQG